MSLTNAHRQTLQTVASGGSVGLNNFQAAADAGGVAHRFLHRPYGYRLTFQNFRAYVTPGDMVSGADNPALKRLAAGVREFHNGS